MCYVIIGNSAAAIGAAEAIREKDKKGRIIMVTREKYNTYARPLISYYLSHRVDEKNIYYRPEGFYGCHNIETFWGQDEIMIDAEKKEICLKPQDIKITYQKLLLATGGKPHKPSFIRQDFANTFFFHSFDDVKKIDSFINENKSKTAVVIGGGLIGLKAAESLALRGLEVKVIEAEDYILSSILDYEGAKLVEKYLQKRGISFLLSSKVESLEGDEKVGRAVLTEGEVSGDIFIVAAGITANYDSIKLNGLKIGNGIEVNEYMETSLPDIYAAGDVAEAYELISGQKRLVPILPNAYLQGRTAGFNMAGERKAFSGSLAFNSLPVLGLNMVTAGLSYETGSGYEVVKKVGDNFNYKKLVFKNNVLVGFILIGDISRCGLYRQLVAQKVAFDFDKRVLLQPDFSLLMLGKIGISMEGEKFYDSSNQGG